MPTLGPPAVAASSCSSQAFSGRRVVVEHGDPIGAGDSQSLVTGGGKAGVGRIADQMQGDAIGGTALFDEGDRVVVRTVVHEDQLKITHSLLRQVREQRGEVAAAVEVEHHDARSRTICRAICRTICGAALRQRCR